MPPRRNKQGKPPIQRIKERQRIQKAKQQELRRQQGLQPRTKPIPIVSPKKITSKQRKQNNKQRKQQNSMKYDESSEKKDALDRQNRRMARQVRREAKNILSYKRNIVNKYGKEPTVCFYYYLWNAVGYAGEERVRKSFASIRGQGDEIIVGDYGSTDRTKEIALEYGFKVVDVEKTPGVLFHELKIANKIIKETKCNFLVDLNVNTVYPKNMGTFYKDWIPNNDISQKFLVGRGIFHRKNGRKARIMSASCLFYVPFLKEVRGYDERAYYGYGSTHYAYCLLVDVLKLKLDNKPLDMHHLYHIDFKSRRIKQVFKIENQYSRFDQACEMVEKLLDGFFINFEEAIKNVQNSYW